ncbi:MAG: hypothetical protein WB116_05440 [Candidatus Dormiibacterota bacterium]
MLVAALGYIAVRVGGIALAIAGTVAILAAAGIVWDVCRERGWLGLGSGHTRSEQPVSASDPARDLVVSVVEEHFTPFHHKALIVEIKVSAYNKSRRQLDLTGFVFTNADPYSFALHGDKEVQAEVDRLKRPRARLAGLVDPGETIYGWHVYAFPHMPDGGRPGYEIYVTDAVDDKYGVKVPRRPRRDYVRAIRN